MIFHYSGMKWVFIALSHSVFWFGVDSFCVFFIFCRTKNTNRNWTIETRRYSIIYVKNVIVVIEVWMNTRLVFVQLQPQRETTVMKGRCFVAFFFFATGACIFLQFLSNMNWCHLIGTFLSRMEINFLNSGNFLFYHFVHLRQLFEFSYLSI